MEWFLGLTITCQFDCLVDAFVLIHCYCAKVECFAQYSNWYWQCPSDLPSFVHIFLCVWKRWAWRWWRSTYKQCTHTQKRDRETRTLTESWIQVIWLKCGSFKNTSQNSNWIEYASFKWKISQIKYTQIIIIMMSSEMMALSQKWNVYSYLLELKCLNRCHQAIEKTDMLRVNER